MSGTTRRTVLGTGAAGAVVALSPATAGAQLPAATVRARRKFFGEGNVTRAGRVRPDRVILSWFGCTSFAMAFGGHVVLLDAWVPRGEFSGVVPTEPAEVAALRPSHVFIGHGHFDHAADAGTIAAASGAVVVGTPAHCRQAASQAPGPLRTHRLAIPAPGDRIDHRAGRLHVTALRHLHSAVARPSGDDAPMAPLPDVSPLLTHPPRVPDSLHELSHLPDEEGGCVLYRFRLGSFSLVWHDSSGPIRDEHRVAQALRSLPPSTVQVAAIQGFGQFTNGLRDPLDYVQALRPAILVPSHHDNWAPPLSAPAASYEGRLREGLARFPERSRPRLRFLRDPRDYVAPRRLTFRL